MNETPENLERWTRPDDWASWVDHWAYSSECFVFIGRHRDSDILTETNFRVALEALGGESDTVEIIREGHWAVGWVEWIAIHESDSKALRTADEIVASLEDYPVLDNDALSDAEYEAVHEFWHGEDIRWRVGHCIDAGVSIFAARRDALDDAMFDHLLESVLYN